MFACLHAPGNLALLVQCAGHFSPHIEETSPDTAVFDIHGLRRIFGTPEHIAAEIHRRVGLPASIALASNPDAAVHAARGIPGVTVIPPGRELATLAPLPVYLLGGSPEFAATLYTWGIGTFGEFAALPPLGVAERLGDEGVHMQRLARGEGQRLLRLRGQPLEFQKELEPESPVDLLESLLLLVACLLGDLCEQLRSHSLAANEIHLRLKLERASDHTATLRLPVPMLDPKVFLKLLQLELNNRPPQAPVERIHLQLTPVESRTVQHDLFLPSSPESEKLEITLARIRNLVGASNVAAPVLLDTHRPDSFRMGTLLLSRSLPTATARPQLGLRRFRPSHSAQVICATDGQPARISSSKVEGRIIACAGPWWTSGDWWTGDPWDCQEWDVDVGARGLFRIHLNCRTRRWRIEGSYD